MCRVDLELMLRVISGGCHDKFKKDHAHGICLAAWSVRLRPCSALRLRRRGIRRFRGVQRLVLGGRPALQQYLDLYPRARVAHWWTMNPGVLWPPHCRSTLAWRLCHVPSANAASGTDAYRVQREGRLRGPYLTTAHQSGSHIHRPQSETSIRDRALRRPG